MQVKEQSLVHVGQEQSSKEQSVARLEEELDAVRADLRKVTEGQYGLAEALDTVHSLKHKIELLRKSRDEIISQVCGEPPHAMLNLVGMPQRIASTKPGGAA
jgi:hypothetical protein